MIYDLAGLVRIGGELTSSAFLIPFFRSRSSNHTFAQELDEEHRIVRFLVFNPSPYTHVATPLQPMCRIVGEVGVMAFVRRGAVPVVGEAQDVLKALRAAKLVGDGSPFFELDAYGLTGQTGLMRGAVERARLALGDGPLAARWAITETALLRNRLQASEAVAENWQKEIAALAADFERRDWPKRWGALWRHFNLREHLVYVGLDFVVLSQQPVTVTVRVLAPLLKYRRGSQTDRILQAAERWLVHCARVQPTIQSWPRVWRAVASSKDVLPTDLGKQGIDYLRESAASGRITTEWAGVATVLRQKWPASIDLTEEILGLAREILISGDMPASALRPVITSLLAEKSDTRSIRILEDWVKSGPSYTNAWIDAFLAVLDVKGGDRELIDAGLSWIQNDPGNLRRWSQIYSVLGEQIGPSVALHEAARDWVLRANRRMTTWPVVAMDVLGRRSDALVDAAVRQWLEENPEHTSAPSLEKLLVQ